MSPPNNYGAAFDVSVENVCKDSINEKRQLDWQAPSAQGLYDPQNEHEACGVGFIVAIDGKRSHKVIHKCLFKRFKSHVLNKCECERKVN